MPKVFISHCTLDRPFVEAEVLPVLRAAGLEYWYCKEDIPTSALWVEEIVKALESCDAFLLVLSPEAAGSEWVRDEVHIAVEKFGRERLILVLLRPCKLTDFHTRLPRIQNVDYTIDAAAGRQVLISACEALRQLPPRIDNQAKGNAPARQRPVSGPAGARGFSACWSVRLFAWFWPQRRWGPIGRGRIVLGLPTKRVAPRTGRDRPRSWSWS
jgi:hypothetical protein